MNPLRPTAVTLMVMWRVLLSTEHSATLVFIAGTLIFERDTSLSSSLCRVFPSYEPDVALPEKLKPDQSLAFASYAKGNCWSLVQFPVYCWVVASFGEVLAALCCSCPCIGFNVNIFVATWGGTLLVFVKFVSWKLFAFDAIETAPNGQWGGLAEWTMGWSGRMDSGVVWPNG